MGFWRRYIVVDRFISRSNIERIRKAASVCSTSLIYLEFFEKKQKQVKCHPRRPIWLEKKLSPFFTLTTCTMLNRRIRSLSEELLVSARLLNHFLICILWFCSAVMCSLLHSVRAQVLGINFFFDSNFFFYFLFFIVSTFTKGKIQSKFD